MKNEDSLWAASGKARLQAAILGGEFKPYPDIIRIYPVAVAGHRPSTIFDDLKHDLWH
jgi:hypothetical protein